ncbi:hypothetical protein HKD37_09G025188 [Glycine soja]
MVFAKDVGHVDHVADEVHEQPQEPITNHVNVDTEGFPGGPYDITVLMSYGTKLKLAFHGRKVEKFGRPAPEIEGIVTITRLSSLIACLLDTGVFHTFDALDEDHVVDLLVELLEISTQEAKDEIEQCKEAYVRLA